MCPVILIIVQIVAELGRCVGVPEPPCFVVDDRTLKSVIGIDIGDECIQRFELRFRVPAARVHHLNADRIGVHPVVRVIRPDGYRSHHIIPRLVRDAERLVVPGIAVPGMVGDLVQGDALHDRAVFVDNEV